MDEYAAPVEEKSIVSRWSGSFLVKFLRLEGDGHIRIMVGIPRIKGGLVVHQVQHYILVVQATDGGEPALSSTVTVYCNVVDLNDNAPIFEAGPNAIDIMENVTVGSPVLTVTAQDLDSGDNGRVVYAVVGGDDDGDFGVAANGTIFTQRPLDREEKQLYNLVLSATDSPLPPARPLSSTVQVSLES